MNDKALHVIAGVLFLLYAAGALWVDSHLGRGAAAAYVTTLGGIGIEAYQRIRHEGQSDVKDALATALPGWLYWGALVAPTLQAPRIFTL